MRRPAEVAASSHIRMSDFQAVRRQMLPTLMCVCEERVKEVGTDRGGGGGGKKGANRLQMSTWDKPKSPWREGHSRSILERRCRLSAFITVREAEFGLIVYTARPWIKQRNPANITDPAVWGPNFLFCPLFLPNSKDKQGNVSVWKLKCWFTFYQ